MNKKFMEEYASQKLQQQIDNNAINPAGLNAFLREDFENAAVAMTPGGIEAQEAYGQQILNTQEIFPREMRNCTREDLESLGFVFGNEVDDLFIEAILPEGWTKEPTDHSMWSHLRDSKHRLRGEIFYKAAFYDRSAFLRLCRRFSYGDEPIDGWNDENYRTKPWHCVVKDGETILWESPQLSPKPHWDAPEDVPEYDIWNFQRDTIVEQGRQWLEDRYPDYKNPLAYWEED